MGIKTKFDIGQEVMIKARIENAFINKGGVKYQLNLIAKNGEILATNKLGFSEENLERLVPDTSND